MSVSRRVYIVNDSGHDFRGAEQFGELVIMSDGEIQKFKLAQMRRKLAHHLDDSHPDDLIMHTGPNVMCSMACSIFAVKHGHLNLLLFRGTLRGKARYEEQRINLKSEEKNGQAG